MSMHPSGSAPEARARASVDPTDATKTAPRGLVLAAGKGTRMGGDQPKVLVRAAGRTLLSWVLSHLREAGIGPVTVVLGFGRDEVAATLPAGADWVEQAEQLGTGHAVQCAAGAFEGFDGTLVVACGDMPLVRPESYGALVVHHCEAGAAATLLTAKLAPPHRYGRVVRDEAGRVLRNVEAADATEEELAIDEVNTGVYAFDATALFEALAEVKSENEQGEYYLPDVLEILIGKGRLVSAVVCGSAEEAHGVNTPEDLAKVEARLRGGSEAEER